MSDVITKVNKKSKQKIKLPSRWKVVMINDNVTPMDFVTIVLNKIFNHSDESAVNIMTTIHNSGSGIAGVYNFEIAEVKVAETTSLARSNNFPLQVKLEEDS